MKNKKILIVFITVLLLSNILPVTSLFEYFIDQRHYQYSNYNGSLTFTEYWSRDYEMMKRRHQNCLKSRPELKDKQLYRLFTKNPFAFWRWRLYFFDERYKLPYKDWNEIKKLRALENVKEITGCSIEF